MKIERIELNNFGSYEDLNSFDVMTNDQSKRIIIVGGEKWRRKNYPFYSHADLFVRSCIFRL